MKDFAIIDGIEYRFYDHLYAVSRCGKVLRNMQPAMPIKRPDGYLSVGRRRLAHRMVAAVWLDKSDGANHVHHINHDKQDNRADNLEWLTPKLHHLKHPNHYKGHSMSEAGKQRLRTLRLGSKTSDATKQKQREATVRNGRFPPPRPIGYKHSQESIEKMQLNGNNKVSCEILGIAYGSFSEAGRALGEKPHTLRKRCLSKNFPDHKLRT